MKSYKRAIIKQRNFAAKLPEDFDILLRLSDEKGRYLLNVKAENIGYQKYRSPKGPVSFRIDQTNSRILFTGNYGSYLIVRLFQKKWETFFPKKYLLEYGFFGRFNINFKKLLL